MRIECPTCSIGFNVSDEQVGTKGLCPKCETKFIIPADPDDDIEVLAEGKVKSKKSGSGSTSKEKSDSKEKAKSEPKSDPATKSKPKSKRARDSGKLDDDEERRERKAKKRRGASTRLIEGEDEDTEFDASGAGKALGLLALGLVLGLVIGFALGRLTAGGGDDGSKVQSSGDTKDPFGLREGE